MKTSALVVLLLLVAAAPAFATDPAPQTPVFDMSIPMNEIKSQMALMMNQAWVPLSGILAFFFGVSLIFKMFERFTGGK